MMRELLKQLSLFRKYFLGGHPVDGPKQQSDFVYRHKILTITTESTWTEKDVEDRKKLHLIVIKTITSAY